MSQTNAAPRATADASNQNDKPTKLVAYIRGMLQELHKLTPAEAGPTLPYLLAMAHEEAEEAESRLSSVGRQ